MFGTQIHIFIGNVIVNFIDVSYFSTYKFKCLRLTHMGKIQESSQKKPDNVFSYHISKCI